MSQPTAPLTADILRPLLTTRWLGRSLHCFETVDSTNTAARDLARDGAAEGTVVIAERQRRGRGRLGRSWVSPPHLNLYVSVVLRPSLPVRQLAQISLLAGVATCDAVAAYHSASLKWPNDVRIAGRKVAGILMEMEGEGARRFVIVGIGVNLNADLDDFPPELRDKAGSVRLAVGRPVDRAAFTAALLARLEERYDQLGRNGFAPIAAAWHERADMIGRYVRVALPGDEIAGVVAGLDEEGALRVRLSSGEEQTVVAGDVTVIDGNL